MRGKELYRLFAECGWHVLLDTPANDFGQIMSPDPKVLERAIEILPIIERSTSEERKPEADIDNIKR